MCVRPVTNKALLWKGWSRQVGELTYEQGDIEDGRDDLAKCVTHLNGRSSGSLKVTKKIIFAKI